MWTDFPSTPAANPHLNNDLDLEVVGPGGTFLGNVFSGGQSTTGGSPTGATPWSRCSGSRRHRAPTP